MFHFGTYLHDKDSIWVSFKGEKGNRMNKVEVGIRGLTGRTPRTHEGRGKKSTLGYNIF